MTYRTDANIYRKLRTEIAGLKAELEDIKQIMGIPPTGCVAFGLTKSQNVIFSLLMSREVATRDAIMQVLYGARPDNPPDDNTVDVLITQTRKRLPSWVKINNDRSNGWFIAPEIKARLRQTLAIKAFTSDYSPKASRAQNGHAVSL